MYVYVYKYNICTYRLTSYRNGFNLFWISGFSAFEVYTVET